MLKILPDAVARLHRRLATGPTEQRLKAMQMTAELGMNLAGVERVFELEQKLQAMARKVKALELRARELTAEVERLEALRRELRAEVVPYRPGGELVRLADLAAVAFGRKPPTKPGGGAKI